MGIGRPEQAGVLALVSAATGDWSKVAGLLVRTGSVGPVMSGQVDRIPLDDRTLAAELTRRLETDAVERAEALIADLADRGVRLVTCSMTTTRRTSTRSSTGHPSSGCVES